MTAPENKDPTRSANSITADEAEQYDRQIRIWGVKAQERLQEARVLVSGFRGVGSETLKSLCLAGVGHLYIHDDSLVTSEDLSINLFIPPDAIGKARSEAGVEGIQELNPRCKVEVVNGMKNVTRMCEEGKITLCCVCDNPLSTNIVIAQACQSRGVKFMSASTVGQFFGYMACSLGLCHTFTVDEDSKSELHTESYPPFPDLVSSLILGQSIPTSMKRKGQNMLFALQAMWQVEMHNARSVEAQDEEAVRDEITRFQREFGVKKGYISGPVIQKLVQTANEQVAAVTTILGGLFAQEALKIIGGHGRPFKNLVLFDVEGGEANVYTFGEKECRTPRRQLQRDVQAKIGTPIEDNVYVEIP